MTGAEIHKNTSTKMARSALDQGSETPFLRSGATATGSSGLACAESRKVSSLVAKSLKSLDNPDCSPATKLDAGYVARVEKRRAVQGALADFLTVTDYDERSKPITAVSKTLRNLNWCHAPCHPVHLGSYPDESARFKVTGFNRCNSYLCPTCEFIKNKQRVDEIMSACRNWRDLACHNHLLAVTLTIPRDKFFLTEDRFVAQHELFEKSLRYFTRDETRNLRESVGLKTSNVNIEITYGTDGIHVHAHSVWFVTDKNYHKRTEFELSSAIWELWNKSVTKAASELQMNEYRLKNGGFMVERPRQVERWISRGGKRFKKMRVEGGVTCEKVESFDDEAWAQYIKKYDREEKTYDQFLKEKFRSVALENVFTGSKTAQRYNKENKVKRYTLSDLINILRFEKELLNDSENRIEISKEIEFAKKMTFYNAKHLFNAKMYRWGKIEVDGKMVSAKGFLVDKPKKDNDVFQFEKSSDRINETEIAKEKDKEIKDKVKKGCGLNLSNASPEKLSDVYKRMCHLRQRKLMLRKDIKKRLLNNDYIIKIKGRVAKWAKVHQNMFSYNTDYKTLSEKKEVYNKVYSEIRESRKTGGELYNLYINTFCKKTSVERLNDYLCTVEELNIEVEKVRAEEKYISAESKERTKDPMNVSEERDFERLHELIDMVEQNGARGIKIDKKHGEYKLIFYKGVKCYNVIIEIDRISLILDWGPPKIIKSFEKALDFINTALNSTASFQAHQ